MLEDIRHSLEEVRDELDMLRGSLDPEARREEIASLEESMTDPDFWNDQERAQRIIRRRNVLEGPLNQYEEYRTRTEEALLMVELSEEEGDDSEAERLRVEAESLAEAVRDFRMMVLLSGEYDSEDAIMTINPGAGGLDAQDWAEMLLKMYVRWAEHNGYSHELLDLVPGEEAGIKEASLAIKGENVYGLLKAERGVHRIVRISPFDSSGRRHTSFASVDIMPDLPDDDDDIEIRDEELRVDTYRASGAGGQHVNKTDSAVRITHEPSGIVVTCQNERSQHKNRAAAMKILRARLRQRKEEEKAKELAEIRGDKVDITWGNQIRSYVFQPYTLVKDHRTGVEKGNIDAVMDGEIDEFIRGYLERRAEEGMKASGSAS
ncbi:MAG: peptide chain release factor 2 [Bacillota bacterium]